MKTLEYRFKLDKNDFQAISKAVLKHRMPKAFIIFVLFFNIVVILPLFILEALNGILLNSHLFVFCLEALLYILIMFSLNARSTTLFESSPNRDSTIVCKLHEDRIEFENANATGSQLYSELFSAIESKDFFLFFVSKGALMSLPKRLISTEEEILQIRLIIKKVPERKKTKSEKRNRWGFFVLYAAIFVTVFMLLRTQS